MSFNESVNRDLLLLKARNFQDPGYLSALDNINNLTAELARKEALRDTLGSTDPKIWASLSELWKHISCIDIDSILSAPDQQRDLTLATARFTRNLLVGCRNNQNEIFIFEPSIRAVAHTYTSHMFSNDYICARLLMQTLSNLVTSNEDLIQKLWTTYLSLPEEKNILIRALTLPDDKATIAGLVFISNCLANSQQRMHMTLERKMGRRICVTLLDILSKHVEKENEDMDPDLFEIGWSIFQLFFNYGFTPLLISATTMEGEIVNPHQTTLLKLLDSYLIQFTNTSYRTETTNEGPVSGVDLNQSTQIVEILSDKFLELATYLQTSIKQSLGITDDSDVSCKLEDATAVEGLQQLRSLDVLLPKACEAVVLLIQCFCTLSLLQGPDGNVSDSASRTKHILIEKITSKGVGLLENVIDLLRLLDLFLPRIMLGKASWSTPRPDAPSASDQAIATADKGFSYLKRDLVRLVGVLAYENRMAQDRIRAHNGITVIMNMCVADERNPYLREHALFALRNILHENVENQAIVNEIKPTGTWDENGYLRDSPSTRK
ncbi:hypothetical protein PNOK_0501200 [Pyrrhoderma noxium]|uniref:Ataxin-10 homolog n=1 Tax=Pyrrhoderma noxium TaxID=2282107 RepID=A0A286UKI5_9AGAM|nr:hypothetical protein PNOK_0501200 [Pyrrhoderma noxium]